VGRDFFRGVTRQQAKGVGPGCISVQISISGKNHAVDLSFSCNKGG
jgi:hypothetical protein